MKSNLKSAFRIVAGLLFLTMTFGCQNNDETDMVGDPTFILLGEWDMEKAFKNDRRVEEVPENPQIGEVTEDWWFFKDGVVATEDGEETLVGRWQLINGNSSIRITINRPSSKASTFTYKMVSLTDERMIWNHVLNGDNYRYEFELSSKETPASVDEI